MAFGSRRGFTRSGGSLQLRLDETEVVVLTNLFGQLEELVEPVGEQSSDPLGAMVGIDDEATVPQDPAVMRLFPDAYADDSEASAEFRRFTERGLREVRSERLLTTTRVLGRIEPSRKPTATDLTTEESTDFLGSINDLRLVLGSRLGIVEDDQEIGDGWEPDDPRLATLAAYQWLTWLQSTLLDALAD